MTEEQAERMIGHLVEVRRWLGFVVAAIVGATIAGTINLIRIYEKLS